MTVNLDTPDDVQSTTHNGQDGYGDEVDAAAEHIAAAREAMARISEREAANVSDREEVRDPAIVAASDAGMSPPAIARALGMSVSNVRAIIKLAKAAGRGR